MVVETRRRNAARRIRRRSHGGPTGEGEGAGRRDARRRWHRTGSISSSRTCRVPSLSPPWSCRHRHRFSLSRYRKSCKRISVIYLCRLREEILLKIFLAFLKNNPTVELTPQLPPGRETIAERRKCARRRDHGYA